MGKFSLFCCSRIRLFIDRYNIFYNMDMDKRDVRCPMPIEICGESAVAISGMALEIKSILSFLKI